MSFADYLENKVLDHVLGGPDFTRPATVYIALSTTIPTEAGGMTEPAGGAYARKDVTNNATNFPAAAAGAKANGVEIAFVQATAAWGEILGGGIMDALTLGNMLARFLLTSGNWDFTGAAATDILTAPGHGLANNDRVVVRGAALPAGLSADTVYWVVGVSGGTFQLSLTQGGAAIDLTADGAGRVFKLVPKTVGINDTAKFAVGDLDITLD